MKNNNQILLILIIIFLGISFPGKNIFSGELLTTGQCSESGKSLRSTAKQMKDADVKKMLLKYNFYDNTWNKKGSYKNTFIDNKNGTISDNSTGLMWQQEGSSDYIIWKEVPDYIYQLNQEKFAGYSDWRFPTLEELASLVESKKINQKQLNIAPAFSLNQRCCWSSDFRNRDEAWGICFEDGFVLYNGKALDDSVRAVRSLNSK
jgi:hypothetical protein